MFHPFSKPIAEAESEYAAQWFLWGNLEAAPTAESPATLLRETADIPATRAALMEAARKEYLQNVAADLEDVERRLREWIAGARMLAGTAYKTGIHSERLWLKLLHAGFRTQRAASAAFQSPLRGEVFRTFECDVEQRRLCGFSRLAATPDHQAWRPAAS